jgi:hypothetical protein
MSEQVPDGDSVLAIGPIGMLDRRRPNESRPRSAASRTLIAVNGFVIDARWNTVEDVIGTRRSRLAIP